MTARRSSRWSSSAAHGWRIAERLTPATYVAWSPWLLATGVALLL